MDMKDPVRLYYNEDAKAKKRIPLVLLDLVSVPTLQLLLGISERDIPCLHHIMDKFSKCLKAKGVLYDEFVVKGHNHISLVSTLGCSVRSKQVVITTYQLATNSCLLCPQ